VLDARMDEVYHTRCRYVPGLQAGRGQWLTDADFGLGKPESVQVPVGWAVVGNAQAPYGERLAPGARHATALPTATALLRLAPALIAAGAAVPASDAVASAFEPSAGANAVPARDAVASAFEPSAGASAVPTGDSVASAVETSAHAGASVETMTVDEVTAAAAKA